LELVPALMLIHLITIPVTNTSVNPARSICLALWLNGPLCSERPGGGRSGP
jgi:glycerol uptake facilitator-like aquaporin